MFSEIDLNSGRMKYLLFLSMLFCCFWKIVSVNINFSNNTLLFVSGWPQSGTSLLNQLFTNSPNVSTMVKQCEKIHGDHCVNWNHEGQWLIGGLRKYLAPIMKSGSMCPADLTAMENRSEVSSLLWNEWSQYWDFSQHVLVEKSPQSMLKIPLLTELFKDKMPMKFLIIIKHPATLNIATPRGFTWKTNNVVAKPRTILNEPADMEKNWAFFQKFLLHNDSSRGYPCTLGWIPAMELFSQQLLQASSLGINDTNIRIVRYEHFRRPQSLCRKIFEFIFDGTNNPMYQDAKTSVCDVYFRDTPRKSISASLKGRRLSTLIDAPHQFDNHTDNLEHTVQRALRFREIDATKPHPVKSDFDFQPELVARSMIKRTAEFDEVFQLLKGSYRVKLESIHRQLQKFGYGLLRGQHFLFEKKTSVLSPWEIHP